MTTGSKKNSPTRAVRTPSKQAKMAIDEPSTSEDSSSDESFDVKAHKSKSKQLKENNQQSFVSSYHEEELYIKRLLARRSFHLPRHNWCQDWMQFFKNNHVLFGLCCHHPLHPLKLGHRFFILVGSIAFGLTATNSVYLWYAYSNEDMNKILVQVSLGEVPLNIDTNELQITHGMVLLWTFGSFLHSIFDVSLWFMTACLCFLEGDICGRFSKFRSFGSYVVVAVVAVMVALASFAIAGRVIYDSRIRAAADGVELDEEQWKAILRFESYSFLLGYGVESLLTYLVYYPLLVTIGISGMLRPFFRVFPCIRFLGGRSVEMERQLRERKSMSRQGNRNGQSFDDEEIDDVI